MGRTYNLWHALMYPGNFFAMLVQTSIDSGALYTEYSLQYKLTLHGEVVLHIKVMMNENLHTFFQVQPSFGLQVFNACV